MVLNRWMSALVAVVLAVPATLALPLTTAGADEKVYAPEFMCWAAMGDSPDPTGSCSRELQPGDWHIDLNGGWVLVGSYTIRVSIPDGRYVQESCRVEWDPVAGRSSTSCSGTFAGLGSEAGTSTGVADGSAYIHVNLPTAGTVTLVGGQGRGAAVVRGARLG